MYKKDNEYRFSPSDLTRFLSSPFASWMERFALDFPEQAPQPDGDDEFAEILHKKGFEHEDKLEAKLIAEGNDLVKIEGGSNAEKQQKTIEAMQSCADIIVQARLELDSFAGYADFLVKVDNADGQASKWGNYHYEVWDTKLASSVKPSFLIQLCCYAEMLEALQGVRPAYVTVALGNGDMETLATNDFYYFYLSLKASFLKEQREFNADNQPNPADSKSFGRWSEYAESLLLEQDHLSQVATITRGQIKKLNQQGIHTVADLVATDKTNIKGINKDVFKRLKDQASIQHNTDIAYGDGSEKPLFKVLPHKEGEFKGLAMLPPHSPLDVFFDIEGYALEKGGLEYLWGNTYFDDSGNRQFIDFWAHNREQEKQCFQDFIKWVYARWQKDPSMHIYHYASYEITACRKLMGRFGVCEYEVDQLLRNNVFVDLYKVVKGGLMLGTPNYSIKSVELLYRGKRDTAVGNGGDSIVVYEAWRDLHAKGEQGDTWQTSSILNDIRDYNIDDCDSTQELVVWLREQQQAHHISYLGTNEVHEPDEKEEITKVTRLRDKLLERSDFEKQNNERKTNEHAKLTENLAWSLEFHRREAKPFYWRLFDRLSSTEFELIDDLECIACCQRTTREPFKPSERARKLAYEYQFDTSQDIKGLTKSYVLLGAEDEDGNNIFVTTVDDESDLENGLITVQASKSPPDFITLIPNDRVNTDIIANALFDVVEAYAEGKLDLSKSAIIDFLNRAKPRIKDHDGGAIVTSADSSERLQQIITAVKNLDNSYLPIQGPPGAGKTYTGKHVIAELVKSGARVGISSNSHKAINNLLISTAEYCQKHNIDARFICNKNTDDALEDLGVEVTQNGQIANKLQSGCVVGTTAWGFSREDLANEFDYLFIDEAGQVAVANLIAMSRSAKNLILIGDQMQLGQPSQGSHPAESGLSILDYLLHETPTIADDMGVFLGITYRMHSKVNAFISQHVYDGKLLSNPDSDKRTIDVPNDYQGILNKNAGLQFVPVQHEGNTQSSDEEVAEIKKLAHELIGRTFHTGKADGSRKIGWDDMLFVAPYNHQVTKLKIALGEQVKVGSVDKFQGQEAPIVFLSMCASDASESARGVEFLLNKNRINVAISRAQTLAIVVGNPNLANMPVNRVEQLKLVNLFSALLSDSFLKSKN